jgi:ABC-type Fe3+ transport system substrate-binding protein
MRYWTAALFLAIALVPYCAMLRGGGRGPAEPAPAAAVATLTILSPHRREVRLEYARGFADWMRTEHQRAVTVRWLDVGGTSKILKELESRFAANVNAPGADLLFGGGVAPYLSATEQNWLAPVAVPPAVLDGIPADCAGAPVSSRDRRWFGVALSGFGILYNRPLVARLRLPVPESWEDLGRPEYFSWVGSGDPRSSGSVHMCYEIILQAYGFDRGWDSITRLCANVRSFGEAGGTVPREVAAGDIAAGMVIDQYAHTVIQSAGTNVLAFVLPERHTMINPDPIGVLRGAPQPDLARLFVEYVLSPAGQRLLYQPAGVGGQRHSLYRMPVRAAAYAEPDAPHPNPYRYPAGFTYDDARATRRWNTLNDLLGVWTIDAHAELRAAWKRVIDRGCRPAELAALCAAPLAEEELAALADAWKDPRRKQAVMRQWALDAQNRYRAVGR